MWRNTVVVEFVEWLRGFNKNIDPKRAPVGFYGMDLYSLHASIDAVLQYLDKADPEAARRARLRYSCFDHFSRKPQEYGYATTVGAIESCEKAVVEQLVELQQKATEFLSRDGEVAAEEFFFAEQNARFGEGCGAILPGDVPRARVIVELARPAHSGDARESGRAS